MSFPSIQRRGSVTSKYIPSYTEDTEDPATNKDIAKNADVVVNITDNKIAFNPIHKIGYTDIVTILKNGYNFDENMNSTALDILALYLRGQKLIFMESKTLCERRLNSCMMPAILLAAVCSILNFILKDYQYGTIIISSLNAANSFILSIINYLKLAEKSQNHLMAAQRFSNLESRLEMQSGRSLFFNDDEGIKKTLEEMEREIREIQSSNQFLVPEEIRYRYPKIFCSNIFSLVKKIKNEEILLINKLKTAVQHIHAHIERRDTYVKMQKELDTDIVHYDDKLYDYKQDEAEYRLYVPNVLFGMNENDETNRIITPDIELSSNVENSLEMPECFTFDPTVDPAEMLKRVQEWRTEYNTFLAKKKEEDVHYKEKYSKIKEEKERQRQMKHELLRITTRIHHIEIRLNKLKGYLEEVNKVVDEETQQIKIWDREKEEAFEKIVLHRQEYIELSDDMNREINQHIHKSQKYRCNPCDFFNT